MTYTKTLKNNDKIICPFCDAIQDDLVQDFLLYDIYGKDSCYECNCSIKLERKSGDEINVCFYKKRKKQVD